MANVGFYKMSVRDFDSEKGSVSFYGTAITAANHDAQVVLSDALKAAIDGVIVGAIAEDSYGNREVLTDSAPADEWAQRETCWLLTLYDSTEKKRSKQLLPTADLDLLNEAETDPNLRKALPLGSGAGAALKAAVEAFALSPWGNAVTLESVVHVGRNT